MKDSFLTIRIYELEKKLSATKTSVERAFISLEFIENRENIPDAVAYAIREEFEVEIRDEIEDELRNEITDNLRGEIADDVKHELAS